MSDIAKLLQAYGEGIDSQGWAEGYDEAVKALEQLVNQEVVKALDSIEFPSPYIDPLQLNPRAYSDPVQSGVSRGERFMHKRATEAVENVRSTYTQDTTIDYGGGNRG